MWERISEIVKEADCTLSVYADDLTISGTMVPEAAIWEVKRELQGHGHRYNAAKERSRREKPAEITGVILRPDGLHPPNRSRKRLREVRQQWKEAKSETKRADLEVRIPRPGGADESGPGWQREALTGQTEEEIAVG